MARSIPAQLDSLLPQSRTRAEPAAQTAGTGEAGQLSDLQPTDPLKPAPGSLCTVALPRLVPYWLSRRPQRFPLLPGALLQGLK